MTMTPEVDIATHIGNVVASLTYGTNVRSHPVMPPDDVIPALCVFVFPSGGPRPEDYCGEDLAEWRPRVNIRVRGNKDTYAATLALAREVRDAVHRSDATLTDYVQISVSEPEPIPLGLDDQGLPEYSINSEAHYVG